MVEAVAAMTNPSDPIHGPDRPWPGNPVPSTRSCRSQSQYGRCRRPSKHVGPHGVPIGGGVWFGYERGGQPHGYGHFDGNDFCLCGRQANHPEPSNPTPLPPPTPKAQSRRTA